MTDNAAEVYSVDMLDCDVNTKALMAVFNLQLSTGESGGLGAQPLTSSSA